MGKTRNRMTNAQRIRLIEWIQAGRSEVEIRGLALQEKPPFFISHQKYLRYKSDYDPEREQDLLAFLERRRASLRVVEQATDLADDPPDPPMDALTPPAATQAHKAPARQAKTISDYIREMLFEADKKPSARQLGRDAFK